MVRIALMPVLVLIACLFAGCYGALHDQISYAVSPDYFHAFKFIQFDIPPSIHNRVGASLVGWYASWWMGFLIGVPVSVVGLCMPDWKTYLTKSLIAFGVVAGTALSIGLGTLVHAFMSIDSNSLPPYWIPPGVVDRVAFARTGTMHNFSYIGGFIGILTGSAYLMLARLRLSSPTGAAELP
jgi:hypothetical protein